MERGQMFPRTLDQSDSSPLTGNVLLDDPQRRVGLGWRIFDIGIQHASRLAVGQERFEPERELVTSCTSSITHAVPLTGRVAEHPAPTALPQVLGVAASDSERCCLAGASTPQAASTVQVSASFQTKLRRNAAVTGQQQTCCTTVLPEDCVTRWHRGQPCTDTRSAGPTAIPARGWLPRRL